MTTTTTFITITAAVIGFTALIIMPLRRMAQYKRVQAFSPTLVSQYHFVEKRSGYGVVYSGEISGVRATFSIQPRLKYWTSIGYLTQYGGDDIRVTLQLPTHTRAVLSQGGLQGIAQTIDDKYSKQKLETVSVPASIGANINARAIDAQWTSALLGRATRMSALFPQGAGVTSIQITPDVTMWKTTIALASATPEMISNVMSALQELVTVTQTQDAVTITDTMTTMEQKVLVDYEGMRTRVRWFAFGCLGLFLLGMGVVIKLILAAEGVTK